MNALAILATAASLIGAPHQTSFNYRPAERATGVTVLCLTSHDFRGWAQKNGWQKPWNPVWDASWDFRVRAIILGMGNCRTMESWRSADADDLAEALVTLGHEYRHSQQHGGMPPWDEDFWTADHRYHRGKDDTDADCWAAANLKKLARKIGIKRRLAVRHAQGC